MRTVVLSDFVGDQIRQLEAQHQSAANAHGRAEAFFSSAVRDLLDVRSQRSAWQRMLRIRSEREVAAQATVDISLNRVRTAMDTQGRFVGEARPWIKGQEGERRFEAVLARALTDDWIWFGGYKNRRGEADAMILGPTGLWVVEVKNRGVRLYVDGETWSYATRNRYGNLVRRDAVDGGERSWGRQAIDVAIALRPVLAAVDRRVRVSTAVILVHPEASIGSVRDSKVNLIETDGRRLIQEIRGQAPILDRPW